MSPEELRAAIEGAPDAEALGLVVRACAARLRGANDDDHVGLVDALVPLAAHASEKVRRALADACDAFPGALFEETYERLAADRDHFVCAAAKRAGERRAERRRVARRSDAADHLTAELSAEIEAKHGKSARTLAMRLAKREVEQYLERMSHESTKLDDAIERALDTLSAELAKPDASLAALRAFSTTLRERVLLQRSLLKRAREYARAVRPVFAPENVASMVEEARAHLGERMGDRASRLRFSTDVPAALGMHADRHAILQALQNLLQNAVEAYDAGAASLRVHVAARALRKGTEIELRIEDHGAGMSPEARAALFVPFRSGKPGGTGVGLLMARKMVEEAHGGSLTVESARGVGTTVTLTLPARQAGVRDRT